MTFTHALSTNNYGPAKFIVDGSAANGTHTTIASALTSASSGDTIFIRPGTYTENLTLKAGVNLVAYRGDAATPNVTIVGKATFTAAGTVTIGDIRLQTNSDFFLAVTGSAASIVNLKGCFLNCSNNTGISFTTSSSSALIEVMNCSGDVGTTGIAIFAHSSAGRLRFDGFYCTNTGSSTTASTASAGILEVLNVKIQTPITTSGTNSLINFQNNTVATNATNATCLTVGGSGGNAVTLSNLNSGTASALSIGSATTVTNCTISSSNTNAVTGASAITYSGIAFGSSSNTMNTTTQTAAIFRPGITRSGSQPAFLAYLDTGVANVTGDGTVYTIIYDTEVYDQNADFTLASSTFTAPYTGRYQFDTALLLTGASTMQAGNQRIVTSNRTYNKTTNPGAGGALTSTVGSMSVLADMDVADTATFTITCTDAGGKVDDISGTTAGDLRTWVSGFLAF